jgi:branched-chain amino acid transport system substrate-binding protein
MQHSYKLIGLAVVAAMSLAACTKKQETSAPTSGEATTAVGKSETGDVIKIGHAGPLTGGIAHLGKDNENGARLAVEEINSAGGVTLGGKKYMLELMGEDDAGDPKTGKIVAQKLVDSKVVGVVGHLNSGVSIPANEVYAQAGIVQISPSSTNPKYTIDGKKSPTGLTTAYRDVATDAQQGPAIANYAKKALNIKSIAVIDDATEYGKGLADQVERVSKEQGVNVVAREATTSTATDFKAILTKIKSKNPDAIMFGAMDDTVAKLALQMKQLGIKARLLGGDGACTEKFIDLAKDAANGLVCTEAGLPLEKMPKGAEFSSKYKARFGTDVQIYAPFAYDAVYTIVNAMKMADSADPQKILAAMPKVSFEGVIGNISFDSKGDLKQGAITVYEVKGGKKGVVEIVK